MTEYEVEDMDGDSLLIKSCSEYTELELFLKTTHPDDLESSYVKLDRGMLLELSGIVQTILNQSEEEELF